MRLREWLDSSGKSPEWLASELGVSENTVRRWISGRHRPRNPEHIARIEALSDKQVTYRDVVFRPSKKKPIGRPRAA